MPQKTALNYLQDAQLRIELAMMTAKIGRETLDQRRGDKGMAETMTIIEASMSRALEEISNARQLLLAPTTPA